MMSNPNSRKPNKPRRPAAVRTLLYPHLGGLGWITAATLSSRREANDYRRRLLAAGGHDPKRVKVFWA